MTSSGANEALLAAYAQHLATQPARTREAYLRDVGVLKALAGEAALTAGVEREAVQAFERCCADSSPHCTRAACPAGASRACFPDGARSTALRSSATLR